MEATLPVVTAVNSNLNNDAVNGDLNTLGGEIVETRVESPVGADSLKDRVKPSGGAIPVLYLNKENQQRRSQSDVINFELVAAITMFPDQTWSIANIWL